MKTLFTLPVRVVCCAIFCFMHILAVRAQNMVFNGSFELYDSLPNETGEWMACTGWNNLNGLGTPDYAHIDGGDVTHMPYTFWCGVYPQDGNAAMSFKTYKDFSENFREYIGTPLIAPLDTTQWYAVSFWITNGDYYHRFGSGTDNIGLLLGTSFRTQPTVHVVDAEPQFVINSMVFNTAWEQHTYYYKPDSAYTCLMMGNFAFDADIATDVFDTAALIFDGAQYFVDNIVIAPIPFVTIIDTGICNGETYILPDGDVAITTLTDTTMLEAIDGSDSLVITHLTVYPTPETNLVVEICNGDSYLLPDGTTTAIAGFYSFNLPSVHGCDSTVNITLTIKDPVEITQNIQRCEGDVYMLPDGNAATTSGIYTTVFTLPSGCDSTIITHLNFATPIIPEMVLPEQICLEAEPIHIETFPEGGIYSAGIGYGNFDPQVFGLGTHTVTYVYTSAAGCTAETTSTITVTSNYANAGPDAVIQQNTTTTLHGNAGGDYTWTPALFLACNTCQETVAMPPVNTMYTLTSVDAVGCIATDSVMISVTDAESDAVWFPNTFTPNGDGMNDYFYPMGYAISDIMSFTIFDRWGERIFESDNQIISGYTGWDGTFNGQAANEGVYVYTANIRLQNNIVTTAKGNVTLVR
ncbi:MAG TPA: gliding motility-associated C-terminal domain-containing protein [Chitinophagales bacterium]|nr:gliding motility-associated C-terminal domain-containing protein [Chitinophagales bacterium]